MSAMQTSPTASVTVPEERVRRLNEEPERSGADFVLYWIQMYHRAEQNWALTFAIQESKTDVAAYVDRVNRWCDEAGRPDLRVEAPVRPARRKKGGDHGTR